MTITPEARIQVVVVREHSGKPRALYVGDFRVWGSKPYVSENLPHEFYSVAIVDLDHALQFARNHAEKSP